MSGLQIATMRSGARRGAYVHLEVPREWRITSDVPVEAMLDADVLDERLPGLLGSYVLPRDAVFETIGARRTYAGDYRALYEAEARVGTVQPCDRLNQYVVHLVTSGLPKTSHDDTDAQDDACVISDSEASDVVDHNEEGGEFEDDNVVDPDEEQGAEPEPEAEDVEDAEQDEEDEDDEEDGEDGEDEPPEPEEEEEEDEDEDKST